MLTLLIFVDDGLTGVVSFVEETLVKSAEVHGKHP